jgi:hypothetical protein
MCFHILVTALPLTLIGTVQILVLWLESVGAQMCHNSYSMHKCSNLFK